MGRTPHDQPQWPEWCFSRNPVDHSHGWSGRHRKKHSSGGHWKRFAMWEVFKTHILFKTLWSTCEKCYNPMLEKIRHICWSIMIRAYTIPYILMDYHRIHRILFMVTGHATAPQTIPGVKTGKFLNMGGCNETHMAIWLVVWNIFYFPIYWK